MPCVTACSDFSTSEADAILFEILTALLWIRNGWEVNIIEEGKSEGKSPDLLASKNGKTWQIECKRQKKTADYTYKETAKRQIMISHIGELLIQYNALLDIRLEKTAEAVTAKTAMLLQF